MPKMISFTQKGDFRKSNRFLRGLLKLHYRQKLKEYGQLGVEALRASTPTESGKTAASWSYEIEEKSGRISIYWRNDNVNDGVNIAVILQYGHGTRNGGYVEGIDYINPAVRPVFEKMSNEIWKEVTSA